MERERLITIEGGPLAGKSNALRELASLTEDHPSLVTLWLDADAGISLFERLALILADALDWPITADEARSWLVNLSRADGPALVLAIDNVGPDRDDLRRDLETLTSNLFGPNLRVVLACDDTVADQLTTQRNGRGVAALGRRAARLGLGMLDNEEFQIAERTLALHRLTFVDGARHSNELRTPWLIRVMACDAASSDEYRNESLVAAMSPVPGLDLIDHARQTFDASRGSLARYRELARAVLADGQDSARPFELMLELMETFIVRRTAALAFIDTHTLRTMIDEGLIREARSQSGENIYVIRLPELMASELAGLVSEELVTRSRSDPADAAEWVVGAASNLPLGDVIAAQAIIDAAIRNHGFSLQLIANLRARPPRQTTMAAGTRTAGWVHGLGIVNMTLQEDGGVLLEHNGRTRLAERMKTRTIAMSPSPMAARKAQSKFLIGDAALLIALLLLGAHAGTVSLSDMLAATATLPAISQVTIASLLLVAASDRSALPPFSGWLTDSMTAPTPVSALMHAGLVNAGGFLLIRFAPLLEAAPAVRWAAIGIGAVAAATGTAAMLVRADTKRALAGSTVSQMGFSILCCGLGAYPAAIWHLVAHGLFKAWLFLGAGSTAVPPAARVIRQISSGVTLLAATVGVGTALVLAIIAPSAELLPLSLAASALAIALIVAVRAPAAHALTVTVAVLGYLLGLGGLMTVIEPAAMPLAGAVPASVALTLAFLTGWVWQARGMPLPARLYARLTHA